MKLSVLFILATFFMISSFSAYSKALPGRFCTENLDCNSEVCLDRGDGVAICIEKKAHEAGTFCLTDEQCQSGQCLKRPDGIKICIDKGQSRPGRYCLSDKDCQNGSCVKRHIFGEKNPIRICQSRLAHEAGSLCKLHSDCEDQFCKNRGDYVGFCRAQEKSNDGDFCINNWDCKSAKCVKRKRWQKFKICVPY